MTDETVIITVRVPRRSWRDFGPRQEVDFAVKHCRQPVLTLPTRCRLDSRQQQKTPKPKCVAEGVGNRPAGRRSVADNAFLASGVSRILPKEKDLLDDLTMARKILAERSMELANLDAVLAPIRDAEDAIRASLAATHNGGTIRGLNLAKRVDRRPMFARLDAIAHQWGKTKSERRFVHSEIKGLRRLVETLEVKHASSKA